MFPGHSYFRYVPPFLMELKFLQFLKGGPFDVPLWFGIFSAYFRPNVSARLAVNSGYMNMKIYKNIKYIV